MHRKYIKHTLPTFMTGTRTSRWTRHKGTPGVQSMIRYNASINLHTSLLGAQMCKSVQSHCHHTRFAGKLITPHYRHRCLFTISVRAVTVYSTSFRCLQSQQPQTYIEFETTWTTRRCYEHRKRWAVTERSEDGDDKMVPRCEIYESSSGALCQM